MLKTYAPSSSRARLAYHLGEGRVLKTTAQSGWSPRKAYHLGEGRVLKTEKGFYMEAR